MNNQVLIWKRMIVKALILFFIASILSVGVVFGRYQSSFSGDVKFSVGPSKLLLLDENGIALADSLVWTHNDDETQSLTCRISNQDGNGRFSSRDQLIRIRVFVPDPNEGVSAAGYGNLTLKLNVNSEDYIATARYLSSKHFLSLTEGAGWIYCFVDNSGNELLWHLQGGQESEIKVTFTLNNAIDTGEFSLRINEVYTNQ